jgi:hypothetical protein
MSMILCDFLFTILRRIIPLQFKSLTIQKPALFALSLIW